MSFQAKGMDRIDRGGGGGVAGNVNVGLKVITNDFPSDVC